jgi:hypothetical protein
LDESVSEAALKQQKLHETRFKDLTAQVGIQSLNDSKLEVETQWDKKFKRRIEKLERQTSELLRKSGN